MGKPSFEGGALVFLFQAMITIAHSTFAPSGREVAPSGKRGPLYWPTKRVTPSLSWKVARLQGTSSPSRLEKTAAVSAWPTTDVVFSFFDSPSLSEPGRLSVLASLP